MVGGVVELVDHFVDPMWRLHNLYFIKDRDANKIKFVPNWAQDDFLLSMWYLNLVLKSRQIGFTTVIDLFMLDAVMWNPNVNARVIADTDGKAKEIFDDKVRFAYDNLPMGLQQAQSTEVESMHALGFVNRSSIKVGTSTRGLTEQYLHVSELGKIALDFPKKALEIKTGAFNTVHAGNFIFVESTAKGRGGVFFDLVETARKAAEEKRELTRLAFKLHFYPWFVDSSCVLPADEAKRVVITKHDAEYFAEVEAEMGVELSREQKVWYVEKAKTMGDKMKEEFPSTPDEPFDVPIEGAFFGKEMVKVRAEKRIRKLPWASSIPVNSFWDLGHSDYTSIWLHQHVWPWNHFLDYYQNSGEKIAHYVAWLQRTLAARGAVMGTIYLPHDASSQRVDATETTEEIVRRLLPGANVVVVERPNNKYFDGIEASRAVLPTCMFDEVDCEVGIKCIDNTKKQWNDLLAVWRDEPVKDQWLHGYDAFEQFARGFKGAASGKGFKRGDSGKKSHRTV